MPSPLHGLNIIEPYPTSQSSDQLPPDFAAQLDLWSTLNFTSIDDFPSSAGTGTNPTPFSLGSAANTLDDLVRMGEEELLAGPSYNNGTIDPFQVAPFRNTSQPAAKKQRTSTTSAASKMKKTATIESPKSEDEDVDEDDEDAVDAQDKSATPLTAAEDKRRRNTAASARFRAKKKEREAALESKAKQLEGRVGELERECEALRRENGWLKGLVVGVTQAGGDLSSVPGLPASLAAPLPSVVPATATGSKRKRE